LLAAGTAAPVFAQTVPSPSKQFCRVAVYLRSSNGYATSIDMVYGQESKKAPTVDAKLAEEAAQVHAFDSEPQALAYLATRGWEIVSYQSSPIGTVTLLQRTLK
jgi:hypothetical protein